ncbi:hypothetical protein B0I35DRAFT_333443, partial [Stachybotrys elegans]
MPLEQTITIINNSGKIISTGKQLVSLFKEAKASYEEKKAQIRSERGLQRAQTFDTSQIPPRRESYEEYYEYGHGNDYDRDYDRDFDRRTRRSYDEGYSEVGSVRSYQSRGTQSRRQVPRSRPALTENNLKTLSEVSSTAPSKAPAPPAVYRSPYAETLPRDMALSKMDLTHAELRSIAPTESRQSVMVPRNRSDPHLAGQLSRPRQKEIDMDLAYGNVPPDLATRYDLEPGYKSEGTDAQALVRKIEGLLDEAHCLQFGATSIIKHLQDSPDTAANVALTLADLSKAVAQVSPAVLAMLKGSSPAVFALLASPQFLIGTGIAVGCTIVMFGGWKIVKNVKEARAAREALAYEGVPPDRPAPLRTQTEVSTGMDEALVLDEVEELSTIETWRRGIEPFGENESADLELITPQADRATRERYGKDDFDVRSHRSTRTDKTSKTSKTAKTSKTSKTHKSSKDKGKEKEREIPERRSSKGAESVAGSVAGSERSSHSKRSTRSKRAPKAIEDGKSRKGDDELDISFRPKHRSDNMLKALFKTKRERE